MSVPSITKSGAVPLVNAAVVQLELNRSFVTICCANYLRFASGVLIRGDLPNMRSGNGERRGQQ